MRRTWMAYQCNDCGAQAPRNLQGITQPVDGAIYTWPMLRAEIKAMGWQNYGGKDFCPACETKHRHEGAHCNSAPREPRPSELLRLAEIAAKRN